MEVREWVLLALGGVFGLLSAEFMAWGPRLAEVLRHVAVSILPPHHRDRVDEEWRRVLEDMPGSLGRLVTAATWVFLASLYPRSRSQDLAIRALDLAVTISSLLLLAPLLATISLAISRTSDGPVFFAPTRVGKGGRLFRVLKFRTLYMDADARLARYLAENDEACAEWASVGKLRRDPRVTPLGRFLRAASLDELPQVWNVIKGEMSMVGPRPITPDRASMLGDYREGYESVRPGVTSPSAVYPHERASADMEYIRSRTLWRTMKVMMLSVVAAFCRPPSE
jgi:exopolysaccharide production protein ExoY